MLIVQKDTALMMATYFQEEMDRRQGYFKKKRIQRK
jgi:hypothetical protein